MIPFELLIIGINILFGIFSITIINALSILLKNKNNPILSNILYFLVTILCGFIYILYIDKIFYSFKLYYLLFIIIGFLLAVKIKFLHINNYFPLFVYLNKMLFIFAKNLLLFSINYKLYKSIKNALKKKKS